MSDIATKHCPDCGDQPIWDFYVNHHNSDDLSVYCKVCMKRRNTINQQKRREERRNQGLPVSDRAYQKATFSNSYLDRHLKRRAVEAAYQDERSELVSSPVELRGVGFGEPESSFSGMMRNYLRKQTRVFSWTVQ